MSINYSEKIPNNVNLSEDRTLQRALEGWQPNFINWWDEIGPVGSEASDVYLRTAVSVDPAGWASFGHVKMPVYRHPRPPSNSLVVSRFEFSLLGSNGPSRSAFRF